MPGSTRGAVRRRGAAATLLMHSGVSWRWVFGGVALVGSRQRRLVRAHSDSRRGKRATRTDRCTRCAPSARERLGALALLFACGAMVEGGIDTWGVLVLRERLGRDRARRCRRVRGGPVGSHRGAGHARPRAAGALGAVRGLAIGAGLAAAGLVLVALAPAWGAAGGLALAAAGISVCWPLLLAHASAGLERPASTIGGVTAIGYLGFVVGPPVVGGLAGLVGLRPALLFLAAAAAVVAVAPRRMTATRSPSASSAHAD